MVSNDYSLKSFPNKMYLISRGLIRVLDVIRIKGYTNKVLQCHQFWPCCNKHQVCALETGSIFMSHMCINRTKFIDFI